MDLLAQFQKSVKNPFKISSVYVIFVTFFLVLIIGLGLLLTLGLFNYQNNPTTACTATKNHSFVDVVRKNNDVIYKIKFNGNEKCFLDVWLTWGQKADLALWVYEPNGNITTYENTSDNAYLNTNFQAPLKKGDWKFVIKTASTTKINFKGAVSFH